MFRINTVIVLLSFLTGCATIMGASEYPVSISSNPTGANFEIANKDGEIVHSGTTPETVTLNSSRGFFKGERYTIRAEINGMSNQATLKSELSNWYSIGNVAFGGLLGWLIVDPATGAMWKLDKSAHINIRDSVSQASEKGLNIVSIDTLSPETLKHLIPLDQIKEKI